VLHILTFYVFKEDFYRAGGVKIDGEWSWLGTGERIDPDDPNWNTLQDSRAFETDVLVMNARNKGWTSGWSEDYINGTICQRRQAEK